MVWIKDPVLFKSMSKWGLSGHGVSIWFKNKVSAGINDPVLQVCDQIRWMCLKAKCYTLSWKIFNNHNFTQNLRGVKLRMVSDIPWNIFCAIRCQITHLGYLYPSYLYLSNSHKTILGSEPSSLGVAASQSGCVISLFWCAQMLQTPFDQFQKLFIGKKYKLQCWYILVKFYLQFSSEKATKSQYLHQYPNLMNEMYFYISFG